MPDIHVPASLFGRLQAYCLKHGEDPTGTVIDLIELMLDDVGPRVPPSSVAEVVGNRGVVEV
jgi:hypothetical protein